MKQILNLIYKVLRFTYIKFIASRFYKYWQDGKYNVHQKLFKHV